MSDPNATVGGFLQPPPLQQQQQTAMPADMGNGYVQQQYAPPPQQQPHEEQHQPAPVAATGAVNTNGQNNMVTFSMQHPAAAQMYAAAFAQMQAQQQHLHHPDPTAALNRPTFVNAKQYRRILKRRAAREVAEEYYRLKRKSNKRSKAYMHESRHRHAQKRPRGPGGRFLTKDELGEYYANHPDQDPSKNMNGEPTDSDPSKPSPPTGEVVMA